MGESIVDRDDLRMLLNGVLLDFRAGKGRAVNEVACDAALDAMNRGERVLLTSGGKLTGTYMVMEGEQYYERREK